ncbi:parathyroid hormone 4 [Lampris incognitus]|uniref:parathyroid hormone 4 n=1 Tax=Lampris incognitus TaxID=2546036 RepID=UPI0024B61234|nr:parathyroid hormone 4 [Lampris incognitus]
MLVNQKPVQSFAVMVLLIFTIGQCQESQSRRAVTEHQLMHDRGRTIQSLKRLIWLSSAIEGLHTAQTRSLLSSPKSLSLGLNSAMLANAGGSAKSTGVESQHKVAVESL